ncbi:MAG: hypothetical protein JRI41_07970 [Deltaproteobacteria bacterium]|nr:hypothetical protein [Deltaproteobacteria bacterium]RLB90074.1 MAG: hypothetical protein DRH50_12845 [Deltaproteobacteria bacterium]RLB90548.1 MAG: hypothetical protein DRH10_03775 [Deltaproteobacteria bacterium]
MTVEPEGEDIRKATKWISSERLHNPGARLATLIEQASVRFDLSPKDAEFLTRFFLKKNDTGNP